jgi:RNA polymerase sigma factor (sigma-70 family)
MDTLSFPENWPFALTDYLLTANGPPHSISHLGGMSGASVWLVQFRAGAVIVKHSAKENESRFYRQIAPTLRENGVISPELLWHGEYSDDYWLVLEYIPQPLPRARWLADPALLAMLRRLHQLALTLPPALPLFQPLWNDEMTAAALSCFPVAVATELRPDLAFYQYASSQLTPSAYISGDPNPLNWGIRDDGTLVLFDWERFGYGPRALDLAITIPGLGSMDDYRLVAARYWLATEPREAARLALDIAHAKVWIVVEFLSFYAAGNQATGATAARLLEQIPTWLGTFGVLAPPRAQVHHTATTVILLCSYCSGCDSSCPLDRYYSRETARYIFVLTVSIQMRRESHSPRTAAAKRKPMLFLFGSGPRSRAAARTAEEQDDSVLVQAALADPLAFTMLYDRYLAQIYSYCYVRLDSREAAEDATSEVFLKAFAGLSSYHGGLFAAWLFQIAHNVVLNLQSRRRPQVALEFSNLPDPGPTLDEMMISHAERSDLRAALAQLPDEQRTVLEMQAAGWSGAQIATALGKSNAAVRMLRHRAVERLRQLVIGQEVPS